MLWKYIYQQTENSEFVKKVCFINNLRSKYLTIGLLLIAIVLSSYDVIIIQRTSSPGFFFSNFKTDVILLVISFTFMLYIYFNQVKSYKQIKKHHKYIHGIIATFILSWCAYKSAIYISKSHISLFLFIASIITMSIIYMFPFIIQLLQLTTGMLFLIMALLIHNHSLTDIFQSTLIVLIFCLIAIIVSQYIYKLQLDLFYKDYELSKNRS